MAPKCRVIPPQGKDACGKDATREVTFPGEDGGKVRCCLECALHLQQQAQAHHTSVAVEKL